MVDPPVMLAPMAGVSNRAFRGIARLQGATLCVTEMVSANALAHDSRKSLQIMDVEPGESPVGIQIVGSDPELMAQAARQAEKLGADLVDINMGCPVPKIVRQGIGSALLNDRDAARELVEAVVQSVSIPVTVKMRAGWDDSSITAPDLAGLFEEIGAQAVTVHARTRADQYARPANWDYIRQVKERVTRIPVIGNGDIETPEDAVNMLAQTGADGVMIGRASFGDPWIFKRVTHFMKTGEHLLPPTAEERAAMAHLHLHRLVDLKGEVVAIPEMRKQMAWYLKGTEGSAEYRARCNKIASLLEAENLIVEWVGHSRNTVLTWD